MSVQTRVEILDGLRDETDKIKAIADVWSAVGGRDAVGDIQPGSLCRAMESVYGSVEDVMELVGKLDALGSPSTVESAQPPSYETTSDDEPAEQFESTTESPQQKFLDATEQAKGILDLIEAAAGSGEDAGLVLADGSLWRAAQCARERVALAERCYEELWRGQVKNTKED